MMTRFVSELNFAGSPSWVVGFGGVFSCPNIARAIAQREIAMKLHLPAVLLESDLFDFVGQVGNLPPILNRLVDASRNFPVPAIGRFSIGGRLPTCPTKSACGGERCLRKVGKKCLRKVKKGCILKPE